MDLKSVRTRILVTGDLGYIGRRLRSAWEGVYDVRGLDRSRGEDVRDAETVKAAVLGCSCVVHLAGVPRPLPGYSLSDYIDHNVVGTMRVAEAAAVEASVSRLVFASTIAMHGVADGVPPPREVTVDTPYVSQRHDLDRFAATDPDVAYAVSKAAAEQVLAWYALTNKLDVTVLRLGPVDKSHLGFTVDSPVVVAAITDAISSARPAWDVRTVVDPPLAL